MTDATLDAGAENCGRLIALVVDALAHLVSGQTLVVMAYDRSSQVDLAAWCRMTGHTLGSVVLLADHLEFEIEKHSTQRRHLRRGTHSGQLFFWPTIWNSRLKNTARRGGT